MRQHKLFNLKKEFIDFCCEKPEGFTGVIEFDNGIVHWYLNGEFNNEDGPAIIVPDGTKYWFKNGKYHREDGPAIEYYNGSKYWFVNDKRHRLDGPAIENSDGSKYFFVNEKQMTEEQHKLLVDMMKLKGLL